MQQVIKFLQEYAAPSAPTLPIGEFDKRMEAMGALAMNWRNMNGTQFKEAMTTAHFDVYFADALSRAFYSDYEYKVGSWVNYTFADTAPDFRDIKRFRMTEPGTLYKRGEKGEATATHISDSEVAYGVEEWARQFDVSWRTIVNDDLGKITQTPIRMANAAARWLDSWVSALYDNVTTQASMLALGAVFGGTGRLTLPNLAIGLNAMMQRLDASGNQMNLRRIHLVIPPVLEIQAKTILADSLSFGGLGGNVLSDFIAGVHIDPYIAFAGANVPWYLFADPSEVPTVSVARLNGVPGPVTYMKESNISMITGSAPAAFLMGSFETGDIEFAVEDIIGAWDDATFVGVTDFRGLYYSNGTTP